MIIAYVFLLIVFVISFIMLAITLKSEDASAYTLWALSGIGSSAILVVSIAGLILSAKTGKVYISEYDKLIQSIDSDKTKVIKEALITYISNIIKYFGGRVIEEKYMEETQNSRKDDILCINQMEQSTHY